MDGGDWPGRHGEGWFGGWMAEIRRADTREADLVDGWRRFAGQTRERLVWWMDGGDSPGRHGEGWFGGWMAEIRRADTGRGSSVSARRKGLPGCVVTEGGDGIGKSGY